MRRIVLILFLGILVLPQLLAQPKVVKETREIWNADSGTWDSISVNTWRYDAQGREIFFSTESGFTQDTLPQYLNSNKTEYDENGNLAATEFQYRGDFGEGISRAEYDYDSSNQLTELTYFYKTFETDSFKLSSRRVFDGNAQEKRRSVKVYLDNGSLSNQIDTLFDDNGCVVQTYSRQYHNNRLEVSVANRAIMTRDGDCRLLSAEYHYKTHLDSGLVPRSREFTAYSANGKLKTIRYERYFDPAGWWPEGDTKIEYDDAFREVFKRTVYYKLVPGGLDTTAVYLIANKYDDEGRLLVHRSYRGNELRFSDSTVYTFDQDGKLTQKKQIQTSFTGGVGIPLVRTFYYDYYCDGQLKTIIEDNLPRVYRSTFEYDYRGECLLEKGEESLTVFPNPSAGKFEIESNILVGLNAMVRVFSATGQEVYSESIQSVSERKGLDLTGFQRGHYYLFIQNGDFSASKRILLLK